MRILEGSFLRIEPAAYITFINPSLGDYLTQYLADVHLLLDLARAAHEPEWGRRLWHHATCGRMSKEDLHTLGMALLPLAETLLNLPVWKRVPERDGSHEMIGMSNTDRVKFLLEWWGATSERRFGELALALARDPIDGLCGCDDAMRAIELVGTLRNDWFPSLTVAASIADTLESACVQMLSASYLEIEDLVQITVVLDIWRGALGSRIPDAFGSTIVRAIDDAPNMIASISLVWELRHLEGSLTDLARRAEIPETLVDKAINALRDRMEVLDTTPIAAAPLPPATPQKEAAPFDDPALKSLFATLKTQKRHATTRHSRLPSP